MSDKLVIKSLFKTYEVCFVDDFEEILKGQLKENHFLIVDRRIMELHGERLAGLLSENRIFVVDAKEHNKTIEYCTALIQQLIKGNIRKNSVLTAIGGGIIQDITAFISSILFRGIDWSFYPTTLLAQADSCIGSKSSMNMNEYKNLLGTFNPPSDIFIDVNFLKTLSADDIKSGIGELLHFYLINGTDLAQKIMDNYEELLSSPVLLKDFIIASLKIKKDVIERDEFDKGERNLFNYGHTFGHAIESISHYKINHGQAVTMGMDIANYVSLKKGYLDKEVFDNMRKILSRNLPEFRIGDEIIDEYFQALSRDKKNIDSNLGCILTSGPGLMKKEYIPLDTELKDIILSY